jgi:hypothetical protein
MGLQSTELREAAKRTRCECDTEYEVVAIARETTAQQERASSNVRDWRRTRRC